MTRRAQTSAVVATAEQASQKTVVAGITEALTEAHHRADHEATARLYAEFAKLRWLTVSTGILGSRTAPRPAWFYPRS